MRMGETLACPPLYPSLVTGYFLSNPNHYGFQGKTYRPDLEHRSGNPPFKMN